MIQFYEQVWKAPCPASDKETFAIVPQARMSSPVDCRLWEYFHCPGNHTGARPELCQPRSVTYCDLHQLLFSCRVQSWDDTSPSTLATTIYFQSMLGPLPTTATKVPSLSISHRDSSPRQALPVQKGVVTECSYGLQNRGPPHPYHVACVRNTLSQRPSSGEIHELSVIKIIMVNSP